MSKRKTNFKWFTNKTRKHLTVKAKKYLKIKITEFYKFKKLPKLFFRYSAFKLWTVAGDDTYYPQLELKSFIFSTGKLNKEKIKVELNNMISKVKEEYDWKDFFSKEIARRRIAYEAEEVSKEEFNDKDIVIITVNDDENTVRSGFPKMRFF